MINQRVIYIGNRGLLFGKKGNTIYIGNRGLFFGKKGNIISYESDGTYLIEFDEENNYLHSGIKHQGKDHHCLYVTKREIRLITMKELIGLLE